MVLSSFGQDVTGHSLQTDWSYRNTPPCRSSRILIRSLVLFLHSFSSDSRFLYIFFVDFDHQTYHHSRSLWTDDVDKTTLMILLTKRYKPFGKPFQIEQLTQWPSSSCLVTSNSLRRKIFVHEKFNGWVRLSSTPGYK